MNHLHASERFHNTKKNYKKKPAKSNPSRGRAEEGRKTSTEHRFVFHVKSKLKTKHKYPRRSLVLFWMLEFNTILLRQYDNHSKS